MFAPTFRGSVSLLLIVGYLGITVGYPQIRPVASKAAGEAYPCQTSSCGCRTREQCRTSCCCHTKQQKIAWALARGIDPNTVAVLTPEEQQALVSGGMIAAKCDSKVSARSCCQAKPVKKPACCATKSNRDMAKVKKTELVLVLGLDAQKCSGNGVEWIQAGFVALPPPAVTLALTQPAEALAAWHPAIYLSPALGHLVRPG